MSFRKSSVEYDCVSSRVIIHCIVSLSDILTELINCFFTNGIVPDEL